MHRTVGDKITEGFLSGIIAAFVVLPITILVICTFAAMAVTGEGETKELK